VALTLGGTATLPEDPVRATRRPPDGTAVPPNLQHLVSGILRGGVYLSAILLFLGLTLWYLRGGTTDAPGAATLPFGRFWAALTEGSGEAVVLLGLLVLVLTPLLRVVVSVAVFSVARDRAFMLVTLLVLATLLASIAVGELRL
jgi:uncharacterized membrane protein